MRQEEKGEEEGTAALRARLFEAWPSPLRASRVVLALARDGRRRGERFEGELTADGLLHEDVDRLLRAGGRVI